MTSEYSQNQAARRILRKQANYAKFEAGVKV